MYWANIIFQAGCGALDGAGWRLARGLRDGCIALTLFTLHAYALADRIPLSAMSFMADVLGADTNAPGVEEALRTITFGGFVLEGLHQAILVVILSLLIRFTAAAVRAGRASLASNGGPANV